MPMILFKILHITCSCICIFFFLFFVYGCDVFFFFSLSLSLSLSLSRIDHVMAPKACKSTPTWNSLGFRSSSSDPIPPLHVQFVMRRLERTSLRTFRNVAFIRSARLSCRTFPTLLSPLSFGLKAGNLYLRDP